jgi:ketosteroid isomerase-like protein
MIERANAAWQEADVEAWLDLFADDAKFFVPGATSISGDHDRASIVAVLRRLMRAGGDDSGQWVIETYVSETGGASLVDQKVLRDGVTHHYHAVSLFEFGPQSGDRFASWWTFVHEYDAFERAWVR